MAILTDPERAALTADIQRGADCPGALTKAQLRAAYDALDNWWEATGAGLANAAIPQPQRGTLTAKQKASMFMHLLAAKYKVHP